MPVYKKIHEVMKAIEYLKKDDKISFGSTNYSAISEEHVTTVVRAELVKNKLIIVPIAQEHTRTDTVLERSISRLTTVNTTYRILDVEDDSYIDAVSSGTGVDTQDKGVGKAMTYSYKYLLLRLFAIPTGEDPDKISSAQTDKALNPRTDKEIANEVAATAKKKAPPKERPINAIEWFQLKSALELNGKDLTKTIEWLQTKGVKFEADGKPEFPTFPHSTFKTMYDKLEKDAT